MKKEGISGVKIAATYIGTIVGAGFATGQEILQFFARFGLPGIIGLIITTVLFIYFGFIIMDLGKDLDAESHLDIIKYTGNKFISIITDIIITFFLFGAFTAMIAGTGALFEQQFAWSSIIGSIIMAVITAMTVLTGFNGVINSISIVVPFLLTSVIGISVFSIIKMPPQISSASIDIQQTGLVNNWLLATILYISYNTVISIAVLGPLGVQAKNKKSIKKGAILGGFGLGLGSFLIYLALSGNLSYVAKLEVPMIYIAGSISPIIQIIYAFILIAEVYTTAVGSLFGFTARVDENRRLRGKNKIVVIVVTIGAFFASLFGFSNLVKYLYPLVGYAGLIMLLSLIYAKYKVRNDFKKGNNIH